MSYNTKKFRSEIITDYIKDLHQHIDNLNPNSIDYIVCALMKAYKNGKNVFILGNGGSASNASHMACDLGKGTLQRIYDFSESRFRVISLTDNVALMTAFGNDLSYDDIFVQQLRNLVNKNDVVIALTASGNSENVLKAIRYANKNGAKTIGFLGFNTGGKAANIVDHAIVVDSKHYGICEDIQLILNHIISTCISKIKKTHDERNGK